MKMTSDDPDDHNDNNDHNDQNDSDDPDDTDGPYDPNDPDDPALSNGYFPHTCGNHKYLRQFFPMPNLLLCSARCKIGVDIWKLFSISGVAQRFVEQM